MRKKIRDFFHSIDLSALLTIIGIVILFSTAIFFVLIAPGYVDHTWTQPTNPYQVQMYEISDPHLYISTTSRERQFVYHLKKEQTLLAFEESEWMRIISPEELEIYVTHLHEKELKLTPRLMLLRKPIENSEPGQKAEKLRAQLQEEWRKNAQDPSLSVPSFDILELYLPEGNEAFAIAPSDGILENWVDANFKILDSDFSQKYHKDPGVIYVKNPQEYKIKFYQFDRRDVWEYSQTGQPIANLEELKSHSLGFRSRQELIRSGEELYAIEGCWYCHTDQTRTLIQDVVLNGSESYPAPPSTANEYIYQKITFPGTRRIGPDLSRVGVKRPSRDWHKGHFWSPSTASKGSIMPSFRHFFDDDPRGTSILVPGIPNYRFEAIFQYLMTKGTRITPPTQAWWLGKDPVQTKEIIEGKKTFNHSEE